MCGVLFCFSRVFLPVFATQNRQIVKWSENFQVVKNVPKWPTKNMFFPKTHYGVFLGGLPSNLAAGRCVGLGVASRSGIWIFQLSQLANTGYDGGEGSTVTKLSYFILSCNSKFFV